MKSICLKSCSLAVAVAGSLMLSQAAHAAAQTINFDDLASFTQIANGYHGYNWDNLSALAGADAPPGTGYDTGVVSSPNVASNGFGNDATLSRGSAFDLISGYFTAAWNDGLNITLTGSLGGLQKYTTTFTVNTAGAILEVLNWSNIDTVSFHSFGGIENPDLTKFGGGTHFVMDDLTVSAVSAVPLPAALPLFGAVLFGLGAAGRRRRRAQAA